MLRLAPAAPIVALVVALGMLVPRTAAADGVYFTESFGGTDVRDELSAHAGSAFRVRVGLGVRRKQLAVELWGAGLLTDRRSSHHPHHDDGPRAVGRTTGGSDSPSAPAHDERDARATDLGTWGVDVKFLQPVAPSVELYLRGGLSRGYAAGLDASGRGLGLGAGVQLKGKVSALGLLFWPLFFSGLGPKITAAAYVESGYEFYRLHGPRRSTDAQLSHLMIGFALGSDF
jgi:hypothetical protein